MDAASAVVHHVYMAAAKDKKHKVVSRLKPEPKYGLTYIRAWRKFRGLTLERLADRTGSTHATISRIERGEQPYSQPILEAIADALQTDPASLLMRDPTDEQAPWSIWEALRPDQRRQAIRLLKALTEEEAA